MVDYNGNFRWDGCTTDRCWTFGQAGDQPVLGRWSNTVWEIGVFRNGTWYLDYNNNHTLDATGDLIVSFGAPGDQALAGDWSGLGWSTIGVNRVENQINTWFLDGSGFFDWNGCSINKCSGFGASGDKPVVWNKSVVRAN